MLTPAYIDQDTPMRPSFESLECWYPPDRTGPGWKFGGLPCKADFSRFCALRENTLFRLRHEGLP